MHTISYAKSHYALSMRLLFFFFAFMKKFIHNTMTFMISVNSMSNELFIYVCLFFNMYFNLKSLHLCLYYTKNEDEHESIVRKKLY